MINDVYIKQQISIVCSFVGIWLSKWSWTSHWLYTKLSSFNQIIFFIFYPIYLYSLSFIGIFYIATTICSQSALQKKKPELINNICFFKGINGSFWNFYRFDHIYKFQRIESQTELIILIVKFRNFLLPIQSTVG